MENNDWKQQLRDRLADYQEPVGDDLWEAIEKRVDAPAEKPTRSAMWIRRWTAAAAVALLIIAGAGLIYNKGMADDPTEGATATTGERLAEDHGVSQPVNSTTTTLAATDKREYGTAGTTSADATNVLPQGKDNARQDTDGTQQPPANGNEETDNKPRTEEKRETLPHSDLRKQPATNDNTAGKGRRRATSASRVSLGLLASNGMSGSCVTGEQMMMTTGYARMIRSRGGWDKGPVLPDEPFYLSNYDETADHKLPISFGLTLRYWLGKLLWAETGLQYTYLRSDFTYHLRTNTTVDRQNLHYLGVPLRLGCELINWGGLSLYVAAGIQADFCVAATIDTDGTRRDMGRDRPQMSADLSLGAQYTFLPHLGFFAEPGLKYYFDNGSQLKNYFKEHDKCLNLRIGLRYDF